MSGFLDINYNLTVTKLRYYAPFKVKKLESSLYKINTCLQNTIICIEVHAEYKGILQN